MNHTLEFFFFTIGLQAFKKMLTITIYDLIIAHQSRCYVVKESDMDKSLKQLLNHVNLEQAHANSTTRIGDLKNQFDPSKFEFFTVILKQARINKEKFEKTPYLHSYYETHVSDIRSRAFDIMNKKYPQGFDWVNDIIHKHYPENSNRSHEEFDHYIECLLQSFYPEAMKTLLYEWAYHQADTEQEAISQEECREIVVKYKKQYDEYKKTIFMPHYLKRTELNFEKILPNPLGKLNHACSTKQFYFIKNDDKLIYSLGCRCGVETQFQHGMFAHFFTVLQREGVDIKSYIAKINQNCEFKIQKQSKQLIVYGESLLGEYNVDSAKYIGILKHVEKVFDD